MTSRAGALALQSTLDLDLPAAVETLRAACGRVEGESDQVPRVGVVLGSGLASLVDTLEDAVGVPMASIPGLPGQGVAGHEARFVLGRLDGTLVLLQAGRYHAYEGHPPGVVAAPVRIMAGLGLEVLIVTNAVGGIDRRVAAGDIVVLDDHINLSFRAPLAGPTVGSEARFPDMSAPFDRGLQALALAAGERLGLALRRGVYAGVLGPSYETAAEVRMLARLGGDVVGMSTVPEVVTARALGMRVLGLSMVTNHATGLGRTKISHDDVLAVGEATAQRLGRLVREVVLGLRSDARHSGDTK